jgi:hypothetical protein
LFFCVPWIEAASFFGIPLTFGVMMGFDEVPVTVTGTPLAAACDAVWPVEPLIIDNRPTALPPMPRLVSIFMLSLKFNAPEGDTVPLPTASPSAGSEV